MKNKSKKIRNKGITLIALVVTIVVMLILATVSIAMLLGRDSLVENAGKAKENTEKAELKEQIQIAIVNAMAKDAQGELTTSNLKTELENQGFTVTSINETNYLEQEGIFVDFSDGKQFAISNEGAKVTEIKASGDGQESNVEFDVNFDGVLDEIDLLMVRRYLLKVMEFTPEQIEIADCNDNGDVDTSDLIELRRVLGLI